MKSEMYVSTKKNNNKLIPISAKEVDDLASHTETKSSLLPLHVPSLPKPFTSTTVFITLLRICLVLFVVIAFSFLFFYPCSSHTHDHQVSRPLSKLKKPVVLLISLDGFRFGYQYKTKTPNIHRLINNGTEAKLGLIPVYPTLTFPNHYSIATGLYPAYHGIVDTRFTDPKTGEKFRTSDNNAKWWQGEPLWVTAANHGLKASTYFWPGSEVHKGSWDCPDGYCMKYKRTTPFEDRVDTVLKYFDLASDKMPSLMTLYFEDPDSQGHKYGSDDPRITQAISRMDEIIGRLINGLEERGVFEDVNIILVGDHGMVSTCTCDDKMIYLDDLGLTTPIPKEWVESHTSLLSIRPPIGTSYEDIVTKLNDGLKSRNKNEYLEVFLKEKLPARLHYWDNDRIAPIAGLVAEGFKVKLTKSGDQKCGGVHGYDNDFFSMRTIFIAHGPKFGRGVKVESFENVEIYNLVTKLLGIGGAPNNGTDSFPDTLTLPSN